MNIRGGRVHSLRALSNMEYKTGLLLLTLLVGSFALPAPEDVESYFFRFDAGRIVGGTQAAPGSHPHMVALSDGFLIRSFVCGGSIITQRTIMTAAHCNRAMMTGNNLSNNARGTVGTNVHNSGGQVYTFIRAVNHPQYNHQTIKNDIGLLITSSNILLSNLVQLVSISYAPVGGEVGVRVAGWGRIRAGGPLSANLLFVDLTTITGQQCIDGVNAARVELNQPNAPPIDPAVELCTFRALNHGTCNGDSGSALRRIDNGQQVGVVSWGFPCALGAPDMFVRLSAFQNFIESNSV